jgi:hypothetical protein
MSQTDARIDAHINDHIDAHIDAHIFDYADDITSIIMLRIAPVSAVQIAGLDLAWIWLGSGLDWFGSLAWILMFPCNYSAAQIRIQKRENFEPHNL